MDPFAVLLGIFLLWVIACNMMALVFVVVRMIEECQGKQAGEQEDGDDDLKEVICQASSRSLGSSSTDSSQGSQSTASSRKSSNSSNLSSDSSATSTKVEISRGALDEIAAFERFIEDYFDLACDNNNMVEKTGGKTPLQGRISAGSSSLSEVLELSI